MPIGPMGWEARPAAVEAALAASATPVYRVSGRATYGLGAGQFSPTYRLYRAATGRGIQPTDQTIGDCVSHATAAAVALAMAHAALSAGKPLSWPGDPATEPIYALSRVEIGRSQLGHSDGSTGTWAAEAVQKYGILHRTKYPTADLTTYDGQRARDWGSPRRGLPDALEPDAARSPIKAAALVTTWEELRDHVATGQAAIVCSNQGFTDRRDSDGFAAPSGTWPHAMAIVAVDESRRRAGALVLNSWGPDWIRGPIWPNDQPPGSFWADAHVIARMIGGRNADSWALSAYAGFPPPDPALTKWLAA